LDTFQSLRGWLKEVAPANIQDISVTLDTFQSLRGWLKELAFQNIDIIFVTLDTFQLLISPYFATILCFLSPPAT